MGLCAPSVRAALVTALVLLASGCAGTSEVGPPPNPPKLPPALANGPPPAWVETSAGERWLNFSTFCWRSASCADYELAACKGRFHAPIIDMEEGETVRFHLGFKPKKVTLHLYAGGREDRPKREDLAPSLAPSWRVKRGQEILLSVLPKAGGDASYVACLRFTPAP